MKLGLRLHFHNLIDDHGFKVLMDFCEPYKDQIDEMSLFSHFSLQAYIPEEEDKHICEVFKDRMAEIRKRGYKRVGINMLTTLGHGDEDYEGMKLPTIVGHNGVAAKGTICPTSDEFKEYTRRRYGMFAQLKPDFMWADDDCRFYHVGALYPCFCDRCIGIFNKRHGYDFTRETLLEAIETPDNVPVRGNWVQFVEDRIADMFSLIEETVHGIDPNIDLGYMSTPQLDGSVFTYNGANWNHYLTALGATRGRPGTTMFDDKDPMGLMVKPMLCAFQTDDYPEKAVDRFYEHENFPYPTYHKSHVFEISECTLALANGANGIYANPMNDRSEMSLEESRPFFKREVAMRPAWDKMTEFTKNSVGYGFYPALSRNYDKMRPLHNGESFFQTTNGWTRPSWSTDSGFHDIRRAYTMSEIGVPLTGDRKNAFGTVLAGDLPDGFTEEELTKMLSGAVLMDAYALRALERRGLGHLTGVKLEKFHDGSYFEKLNMEDPVNFGVTEAFRDTRGWPDDFGGPSGNATLIPLDKSVREITYLHTFAGEYKGVAMTLYKNELGGRVCVMGYAAFSMVDSFTRRTQLQNICDYMTGGKMRAKLLTGCLGAEYINVCGDKTMVTLASLSLDGIEEPKVAVYGAKKALYLGKNGEFTELEAEAQGEYGVFTLPSILAFDTAVIIAE